MHARPGHDETRPCRLRLSRIGVSGYLRAAMCIFMSMCIALVPLDLKISNVAGTQYIVELGLEVEGSEAHAIVPIAAGAAAAAAGAEIGISAEVLYLATAALIAGATGYLVTSDSFQNMGADLKTQWDRLFDGHDVSDMTNDNNYADGYTDGSLQVGGTPLWDDLTSDEKAKFGTPAGYVLGTWDGLEASVGLLQETGGGDWEPTPSGDGDPLSKLKNALKIIGVTGGAVAVGEAAQALADTVTGGIKSFLFGTDSEKSLKVNYEGVYDVDGALVQFKTRSVPGSKYGTHTDDWVSGTSLNNNGFRETYYFPRVADQQVYTLGKSQPTNGSTYIYQRSSVTSSTTIYDNGILQTTDGGGSTKLDSCWYLNSSGSKSSSDYWLNPNWVGFVFGDVTYSGGTFSDMSKVSLQTLEYGQITGTPNDVVRNILNDNDTYIQNINNYENSAPDGQKYAVMLPDAYGETGIQPYYETFVQPLPDDEVTPVPDTKPDADPIEPGPKPDDPTGEWDFQEALDDAVQNLGEGAFGTLFPFCLVVDIKNLVEKVNSSVSGSGSSSLVVPMEDFNVPGADDMVFKLDWLISLGSMARPWWTVLLSGVLIAESVRYFLK